MVLENAAYTLRPPIDTYIMKSNFVIKKNELLAFRVLSLLSFQVSRKTKMKSKVNREIF